MRRVQTDRQQQGFDFTLEILPDPAALGRIAVTMGNDFDTLRFQSRCRSRPKKGGSATLV